VWLLDMWDCQRFGEIIFLRILWIVKNSALFLKSGTRWQVFTTSTYLKEENIVKAHDGFSDEEVVIWPYTCPSSSRRDPTRDAMIIDQPVEDHQISKNTSEIGFWLSSKRGMHLLNRQAGHPNILSRQRHAICGPRVYMCKDCVERGGSHTRGLCVCAHINATCCRTSCGELTQRYKVFPGSLYDEDDEEGVVSAERRGYERGAHVICCQRMLPDLDTEPEKTRAAERPEKTSRLLQSNCSERFLGERSLGARRVRMPGVCVLSRKSRISLRLGRGRGSIGCVLCSFNRGLCSFRGMQVRMWAQT